MDVARRGRRPAAVQLRFGASVRRRAAPRARHRRRARLPGRRARGGHRHVRGLGSLVGPVRHDRDRRRVLRHTDPPRHDFGGGQRDGGGGRHRRHDRAERRSRGCPAVCPPRRAPDGAATGLRRSRVAPARPHGRVARTGAGACTASACLSATCACRRGRAWRTAAAGRRRDPAGRFACACRFGVARGCNSGTGFCGCSRSCCCSRFCRSCPGSVDSSFAWVRRRGDSSGSRRTHGAAAEACASRAATRPRSAHRPSCCATGARLGGGRRAEEVAARRASRRFAARPRA
jgi:hypothetical protein